MELVELGVPSERADSLAVVVIAALEGAIILAGARRDLPPFDALVVELRPLLDASARPQRPLGSGRRRPARGSSSYGSAEPAGTIVARGR
jgi:hypothetical protein